MGRDFAGLAGCIATTVMLSKIFAWPTSLLSSFCVSEFLWESVIIGIDDQTDAGVKNSGSLITEHGNEFQLMFNFSDRISFGRIFFRAITSILFNPTLVSNKDYVPFIKLLELAFGWRV